MVSFDFVVYKVVQRRALMRSPVSLWLFMF